MSIQQQTMLVDIRFSMPRQTVKLDEVARDVEDMKHASRGVVRSSGYYFKETVNGKQKDGLKMLSQFKQSWEKELKYYARYPFAGGFRMLPAALLADFEATNQRFLDSEPEVWRTWAETVYPEWRRTAPQRMGDLFNPADFPSLEDCRMRFRCNVTVLPMAPVDQWRHITAIAPDMAAVMQSREEDTIKRVTRDSHAQLWQDIMAPLKNIVEQLGKDKAKIHETLINNVTAIASLIPAYNAVIGDSNLDAIAMQVTQTLSKITAEDLRKDASVREAALKAATSLVEEFDPYARSFMLDDELQPESSNNNPDADLAGATPPAEPQ